jgi:pimeloyl-ACP methyl ester carboxylesterase
MSGKIKWIALPVVILTIAYFAGPSPRTPEFKDVLPDVPQEASALEKYISDNESKHKLKPDNQARIIWADSSRKKTKFSVVYLHGYGSSQGEGDPSHKDFAKKFGCNLYLSRLSDHGIDTTENMLLITADRLWQSAEQALAIGKALGDHVVIMSTSTGGTLALMLAADYPNDVYALLNMSPNIKVFHPLAFLANNPWGLQISRKVVGGKYLLSPPKREANAARKEQYWYTKYRLEAVGELQEMIEQKMNATTFSKIKQPSLTLYYYKDDVHQDSTVSVPAIIEMNKELGTPDSLKVIVPIPGAGSHVIGSYITSNDVPAVERELEKFAIEKMHFRKSQP